MKTPLKIVFRNKDKEPISLTFEPLGLVMDLPSREQVEFDVFTDGIPLRIDYKKDRQGRPYAVFWEEASCTYVARYKGKRVDEP